ncbi:hypothetical protein AAT17_09345 [Nonlabens sp. MIC269]|uniref:hypothetical protein n=1 Tax=Nonlabens TaxID=363408 RepID=UPI00071FC2F4|nr:MULTISPECIES: hypothetical protein [Nonlabens]ALM21421.1 hypothetical protein AAT17_09345 [Nonlabens sp. MIC269]ARN71862.1 hypothetical protein BST91_09490 [Nonlabens tegetincola]
MKKSLLIAGIALLCLTACRDEKTPEEQANDLIENADEIKSKEDKVKLENEDGTDAKIKYDEDGNVEKIKTDDN